MGRSEPQVSRLLSKLECKGLIRRSAFRPQTIDLTQRGRKQLQEEFISTLTHYLPQTNLHPLETNPSKREDKYIEKISSELIQEILSEIEEGLEGDLELIQEFITRETFRELKARILEPIELALGNYT